MNDSKTARILVVDDDDSVRNSLTYFLEDYDYLVKSSDSAEHALELIKNESFDIAIIDLRLPGMNGDQLIQTIHKDTCTIRFLIHTASSEFRLTSALSAIGLQLDHVFHKPQVNLKPMINTIETMLHE